MKKLIMILLFIAFHATTLYSQIPLTVASVGGNKKASVSERIGLTDITIRYDRPAVKSREGKIWGQLVPVGFTDPGFGNSKAAPWRAGANENTTFEFNTDVTIEGQLLKAGKYGFFIAYDPNECILIFSNNATSWGNYYYNPNEDALRVKVKPVALDQKVEWLKYEFQNQTKNAATVTLLWEKLMIPFTIETDYIKEQIASFRRELRTEKGFIWQSWNQAALWCVQNNTNLEEALLWADSATNNFGGNLVFGAWSTRAQVMEKLGRQVEATALMKKALPFGNVTEIYLYGRQLIELKQPKEALEVFNINNQKNPNQFTTMVGLMRGYSANGDFKNAMKYATLALKLAPDPGNKSNIQALADKLREKKDIN